SSRPTAQRPPKPSDPRRHRRSFDFAQRNVSQRDGGRTFLFQVIQQIQETQFIRPVSKVPGMQYNPEITVESKLCRQLLSQSFASKSTIQVPVPHIHSRPCDR